MIGARAATQKWSKVGPKRGGPDLLGSDRPVKADQGAARGAALVANGLIAAVECADDPIVVEKPQLSPDLLQLALERDEKLAGVNQDSLETLLNGSDRERAQGSRQSLGSYLPLHGLGGETARDHRRALPAYDPAPTSDPTGIGARREGTGSSSGAASAIAEAMRPWAGVDPKPRGFGYGHGARFPRSDSSRKVRNGREGRVRYLSAVAIEPSWPI